MGSSSFFNANILNNHESHFKVNLHLWNILKEQGQIKQSPDQFLIS